MKEIQNDTDSRGELHANKFLGIAVAVMPDFIDNFLICPLDYESNVSSNTVIVG